MTEPQSTQSNGDTGMPYVTVGTDEKGSGCWILVEGEKRTGFAGGREAFKRLGAAIRKQQKASPDKENAEQDAGELAPMPQITQGFDGPKLGQG